MVNPCYRVIYKRLIYYGVSDGSGLLSLTGTELEAKMEDHFKAVSTFSARSSRTGEILEPHVEKWYEKSLELAKQDLLNHEIFDKEPTKSRTRQLRSGLKRIWLHWRLQMPMIVLMEAKMPRYSRNFGRSSTRYSFGEPFQRPFADSGSLE